MPADAPRPPRRDPVVPWGLDVAVAWTWRLLLLGFAVVLLGLALGRVLVLTAALVAALLLTALLQPLVARLRRAGVPSWVAAAGVFLAFVVLAVVALATLGAAVAAQLPDLGQAFDEGVDGLVRTLRSWGVPLGPERLDELRGQVSDVLRSGSGGVVTGALTAAATVVEVAGGVVLALFITLVLLLDGRTVWEWVLRLLPARAQAPADEAGDSAWLAVTAYIRGISLVAVTDATLIALALVVIGVPSVAPLAALTFLGAFLPYVGAATAGMAAVVVALVSLGPVEALLTLGAVLLVQTIDGYVLEPLVLGRAVELHPLAVVLAITLGGLLAGIGGAVVAVPLTGALNAAATTLARSSRASPRPG